MCVTHLVLVIWTLIRTCSPTVVKYNLLSCVSIYLKQTSAALKHTCEWKLSTLFRCKAVSRRCNALRCPWFAPSTYYKNFSSSINKSRAPLRDPYSCKCKKSIGSQYPSFILARVMANSGRVIFCSQYQSRLYHNLNLPGQHPSSLANSHRVTIPESQACSCTVMSMQLIQSFR